MSTSWTRQEDQQLATWMVKGLAKGWSDKHLCQTISEQLKRTAEECAARWEFLAEKQARESMQKKIIQLERIVEQQQEQLTKIHKDLRFYELMLLEEYHLLLRLLGEDQQKVRIHHI